jgi:hypothetical protein
LQYIFVLYLEHPSLSSLFSGVRVAPSLVFYVMFCRSMFVFCTFFFSPFYCLSFLITPLVSSKFSYFIILFTLGQKMHLIGNFIISTIWTISVMSTYLCITSGFNFISTGGCLQLWEVCSCFPNIWYTL